MLDYYLKAWLLLVRLWLLIVDLFFLVESKLFQIFYYHFLLKFNRNILKVYKY